MIKSQAIQYQDFSSDWFKKWSSLLKQESGIAPGQPYHNKAWQNAIILQALSERGYLKKDNVALGFGVGVERVPSALAKLGLKVTATDQDFKTGKRGGWDNGQLTKTRSDLNKYNIADARDFDTNVTFENADMNKISRSFKNKYDIIWSNCALGHLGSIDNSLKFIQESLDCLKPGGIAVHTTETNVVSNTDTIETGGTIILRRKDLVNLFYNLRKKGYQCAPLFLRFGTQPEDKIIGFNPYKDPILLKINASGYVLSQMVLIISKPKVLKASKTASIKRVKEDKLNKYRMKRYIRSNPELRSYIYKHTPITVPAIRPKQQTQKINLKPNEKTKIKLQFKNISDKNFYDIHQVFHDNHPLMIATSDPVNRDSNIMAEDWFSASRPNPLFTVPKSKVVWGGIKPGDVFYAEISIKAPSKPGKYVEEFCFTLEGLPTIPHSEFVIELNVKNNK